MLAAEIQAKTGKNPSEYYQDLTARYGAPAYRRKDFPADDQQMQALKSLQLADLPFLEVAGDPVLKALTAAPGNGAPIGGIKVTTKNGWFAARPSGTEDLCKIYAESFWGSGTWRKFSLRLRVCCEVVLGQLPWGWLMIINRLALTKILRIGIFYETGRL